jgi:hypothetical protein
LVHVPVTVAGANTVNFRILRINGRFIGPQGEEYAELPAGKTLAARYLPGQKTVRTAQVEAPDSKPGP